MYIFVIQKEIAMKESRYKDTKSDIQEQWSCLIYFLL